MAIALVGSIGALATGTAGSVTPAFGQATSAGNLLVAWVAANSNAAITVSGATGWSQAVNDAGSTSAEAAIFYKPNSGASETAPTFSAGTGYIAAVLAEYSGAATSSPVDKTGTGAGTASPVSVTANAADAAGNDLVLVCGSWHNKASTTGTFGDSAGYTVARDDGSTSSNHHMRGAYQILTAGGVSADTDSQSFTGGVTHVSSSIASFLAAVGPAASPSERLVRIADRPMLPSFYTNRVGI